MEVVGAVDGPKLIQFEQSETFTAAGMPSGGWNLNGARFFGQGVMYDVEAARVAAEDGTDYGGIILTVEDGCKFVNPNVEWLNDGLVLYSVSTDSVVDIPTMPFNVYFTNDVQVCAKDGADLQDHRPRHRGMGVDLASLWRPHQAPKRAGVHRR